MGKADQTSPQGDAVETGGTRAALIDAAAELMTARNTLDITLADIAKQSGANSALVKYYFGGKEGLLFAVLERDFTHSLRSLEKLLESGMPPEEMMYTHLVGLMHTYSKSPYLNRLVQMMSREASAENVERIANDFVRPIAKAQAKILKSGVEAGVFRNIDPLYFYFQAVGSAGCLYGHRFALKSAFRVSKISPNLHSKNVKQVVDILMRGILA